MKIYIIKTDKGEIEYYSTTQESAKKVIYNNTNKKKREIFLNRPYLSKQGIILTIEEHELFK
jgi:hypothetical protein|nr:MAG TPA: hypothetical protein [Caudoviricetes sp.]